MTAPDALLTAEPLGTPRRGRSPRLHGRTYKTLHELAVAAGTQHDPAALARLAVERARDLLAADHAGLYWWDADRAVLTAIADTFFGPDTLHSLRSGEGAVGRAFETGEPVLVSDYQNWDRAVQSMAARGVLTAVAVPVRVGTRCLGALVARRLKPLPFEPGGIRALELLAAQVGPTIEAAHLLVEADRRRLEAESLAEIVRLGAAEADPERVVTFISEHACRLLGADFGAIALREPNAWSWHGLWGNRSDAWPSGGTFKSSRGPANVALETGRSVVAERIGATSGLSSGALAVLTAEGARTLLGTPMFSGDEKLGALLLGWRTEVSPAPAQIGLAETLAGYAATVIANARAHTAQRELTHQAETRAVELSEARRRLETLVSNLPGVAYRCKNDPDWTSEFVSEAALSLTGHTRAEFEEHGVKYAALIHPDDRQRVWDEVQEALTGHRPFELVYRLIAADGTEKHVWEQGVGVWSADGELLALEGFVQDVTERRRAEDALRASEARFRRLAENAKDVIWRWELQGTVGISYVSPAVTEILGYTAHDLCGDPDVAVRFAHPEDVPLVASILRGEHAGESMVLRALHKDGHVVWLEHRHVNVYDEDGELVAIEGIARDITERRQMEEQLLRAQRLEAAGRIAGQVAHDFNNLLAPLVGYPELIKTQLPDDHPSRRFCDAMIDAASQMASINQDLLALGRRGSFDQAPMDLNRLVGQALEQTSLPQGISVERELADDLLPINGSIPQLLRVLVNLLQNAREAMADSGLLTVRTSNVYLDTAGGGLDRIERGEYVRLDVEDTGSGIAPEIHSRIFDAFFTTKTTGRRRGSGLGLSVVQAIVEDHQALLDLQTEVGRGTTFSLYFPVVREQILEAPAEGVTGGTESVLIVDDDPGQREVAQEILASLGYTVEAVSSGKEAVERMKASPADLVLVDMVMEGGIDGAETLRRIQRLRPDQRAILFSGFAESDRVRAALATGAALFLRKPVTLARLAQAVRQVLDTPGGTTAC